MTWEWSQSHSYGCVHLCWLNCVWSSCSYRLCCVICYLALLFFFLIHEHMKRWTHHMNETPGRFLGASGGIRQKDYACRVIAQLPSQCMLIITAFGGLYHVVWLKHRHIHGIPSLDLLCASVSTSPCGPHSLFSGERTLANSLLVQTKAAINSPGRGSYWFSNFAPKPQQQPEFLSKSLKRINEKKTYMCLPWFLFFQFSLLFQPIQVVHVSVWLNGDLWGLRLEHITLAWNDSASGTLPRPQCRLHSPGCKSTSRSRDQVIRSVKEQKR